MTVPILHYVSGNVHDLHDMCEPQGAIILLDYVPPRPAPGDTPAKVVVWSPIHDCFLRFDDEPIWDAYGEDYETVERALAAIAKAPKPQKPYVTFRIPLPQPPGAEAAELLKEALVKLDGMPGTHAGPPPHRFMGPDRELCYRIVLFLRSGGVNILSPCCGEPTL